MSIIVLILGILTANPISGIIAAMGILVGLGPITVILLTTSILILEN
jgi:hypothetical protein